MCLEIRTLSVDARPETRNCALVMLFKALSTHGASLTPAVWTAVFNEVRIELHVFSKGYIFLALSTHGMDRCVY